MSEPEDIVGRNAILTSIETRWKNSDQDVFIAAVILNPLYRRRPFRKQVAFNNASITALITKLWRRFMKKPDTVNPPDELLDDLDHWLKGTGMFATLQAECSRERSQANLQVLFC